MQEEGLDGPSGQRAQGGRGHPGSACRGLFPGQSSGALGSPPAPERCQRAEPNPRATPGAEERTDPLITTSLPPRGVCVCAAVPALSGGGALTRLFRVSCHPLTGSPLSPQLVPEGPARGPQERPPVQPAGPPGRLHGERALRDPPSCSGHGPLEPAHGARRDWRGGSRLPAEARSIDARLPLGPRPGPAMGGGWGGSPFSTCKGGSARPGSFPPAGEVAGGGSGPDSGYR